MNRDLQGVYALDMTAKHQLATALLARAHRDEDGVGAIAAAYPNAAPEMVRTAAHHLYGDGPDAVVSFLADAELFLRNPQSHRMQVGAVHEVLYHLYNWMQFQELLPDGRQHVLELLRELKQHVADDDREALIATATELEEAIEGSRDYPQFE